MSGRPLHRQAPVDMEINAATSLTGQFLDSPSFWKSLEMLETGQTHATFSPGLRSPPAPVVEANPPPSNSDHHHGMVGQALSGRGGHGHPHPLNSRMHPYSVSMEQQSPGLALHLGNMQVSDSTGETSGTDSETGHRPRSPLSHRNSDSHKRPLEGLESPMGMGRGRRGPKGSHLPPLDAKKQRKNLREKERRQQVNEKFDELAHLVDVEPDSKSDKVTVLARAIQVINESADSIKDLQDELSKLRLELLAAKRSPVVTTRRLSQQSPGAVNSSSINAAKPMQKRMPGPAPPPTAAAMPTMTLSPIPAPVPAPITLPAPHADTAPTGVSVFGKPGVVAMPPAPPPRPLNSSYLKSEALMPSKDPSPTGSSVSPMFFDHDAALLTPGALIDSRPRFFPGDPLEEDMKD